MARSSIRRGKGTRHRRPSHDLRDLVERLERMHGRLRFVPRFDPLEELVCCILSQHSADANSFPAFTALRERFPCWSSVVSAADEELADVIRAAGLANQKARSIKGVLAAVLERSGSFSLSFLAELNDEEARDWLLALPGVGPKTAAIVLCFGFGRHAIPVDTHVHRVGQRLGLIPAKMSANDAHAYLDRYVPSDLSFAFHTLLIQHGRKICQARTPKCGHCGLVDVCKFAGGAGPRD